MVRLDFYCLQEYENWYIKHSRERFGEDYFYRIHDVKVIYFEGCDLLKIPDTLSEFFNVEELSFFNNKISFDRTRDSIFHNLIHLKVLSLQRNSITHIPENLFQNCQELQTLSISQNLIRELPPNIFKNLTKLESLFLHDNMIEKFPINIFQNLTNLEGLYLEGNMIQKFSLKLIQKLTNLQSLWIYNNPIKVYIHEEKTEEEKIWFREYLKIILPNTYVDF